jgi:hypothetical protein
VFNAANAALDQPMAFDSNQVQALGLKKKSEHKSPGPKGSPAAERFRSRSSFSR